MKKVKAGELLLEFDKEAIQKAGYSLITPVVITNSFEFEQKTTLLRPRNIIWKINNKS